MRKQSLYERAMNFLTRREHSVKELKTKLVKAEFDPDDVNELIQKLIDSNLQSNQRFTENYIRYRSQRGFGSQRIRQELKERGITADMISSEFNEAEIDWFSLAMTVRCKRFGESGPEDIKDRAKQHRFLHPLHLDTDFAI